MIATVTLSPALDVTMVLRALETGGVNRALFSRADAGGKGINVSKTLKSLGVDSVAYGVLGGATGEAIKKTLDAAGVENDFVTVEHDTRRNVKLVDQSRGETTDINAPSDPLDDAVYAAVLQRLLDRLRAGDIAVLAGKAPTGAPDTLYADWTAKLRGKGVRVLMDAEGEQLRHAVDASPNLIKPNADEMRALTGRADVEAAQLLMRRGVGAVLMTLGEGGAIYTDPNVTLRATTPKVIVLSTVGAGDATVAAMAYAMQKGLPAEDAVRLAMACGAAKVTLPGTQAPTLTDIERLMPLVTVSKE